MEKLINYSKIKRGDKFKIIKSFVQDKSVLDLGCVDHDFDKAIKNKGNYWVHGFIKKHSKSLLGVDLEKKEIEKLNKTGFNCVFGNVESFNLKKKFDVINAGEIIEHLLNVGNFLDCVTKHMNKDSKLILTTPNPFSINQFIKIIFANKISVRDDHTCWFDPKTLTRTLNMKGFEIIDIYWIKTPRWYRLGRILFIKKYLSLNFMIICKLKENDK